MLRGAREAAAQYVARNEHKRLKFLVDRIDEKMAAPPKSTRYVGLENIESHTGKIVPASEIPEADGGVSIFRHGDVLFGKLRPYLAKAWLADSDGVCSSELLVLRPKGLRAKFLKYVLLSDSFVRTVDASTYGTKMPRADWRFIGSIPVWIADLGMQDRIAEFLDRETLRLENLIAKKEQLAELIEEERGARVGQFVVAGLDPSVPMRESQVDWLGKIPAHWATARNKVFFRERDERSISGDEELLTVSHITGVTKRSEKEVNMFEAETQEGYKVCEREDVVVNTMWAYMGALGVAAERGMVSPSYNVYRPIDDRLSADYFDLLCRTPQYINEILRFSKGIWKSRLRLYPDEFLNIRTCLPPIEEQGKIVGILREEGHRFDALASKVRVGIERLKEYRTALISAAVTGTMNI